MARRKNTDIQREFDVIKWVDSEQAGRDTCGEYAFCAFCDKKKETPCAKAYNKLRLTENRFTEDTLFIRNLRK